MKNVVRFLKDESGATAIEYGLIAALIAVGIIAAARGLGSQIGADLQHRHRRDEEVVGCRPPVPDQVRLSLASGSFANRRATPSL